MPKLPARSWFRLDHLWSNLLAWTEGSWCRLRRRRPAKYQKKRPYQPQIEGLERREVFTTVQLTSSTYTMSESDTYLYIIANLDSPSGVTVTVDYSFSDGTAIGGGTDYNGSSGTITINPGFTHWYTVTSPNNDPNDEYDEDFSVTLSNPTNATLGSVTNATITITDNDDPPTVSFSSSTYSVSEGAGSKTITASLSVASGKTITVDYATSNGTATGSDYTSASGTLTFNPGDTSKTFNVTITSDSLDEYDETINLTLSNPNSNASLGSPSTATLTITDDDDPPTAQFSASSYSVAESDTSQTITVTLSAASGKTVAVDYATSNDTATAGADYTAASGTLSFAPGDTSETFQLPILNDAYFEPTEAVNLNLSNYSNATAGSPSSASVTITDADTHASQYLTTAAAGTLLDAGETLISPQTGNLSALVSVVEDHEDCGCG